MPSRSTFEIEQEIATKLQKQSGAKEVWLFGSHARGDAVPDSDFDFMLVIDDYVDASEVDHKVESAVSQICNEKSVEIDAVTIRDHAFHHPLEDLHPASVSYACRTQGVRLI
ncbi:MAG: nucleotidyltransferase domain-containing protein [Planctomycetaceae bacterium]|jgi:predicted nucleotidyltransferase|nr:nucleotidyltransferase domain-containing protein [Planctomycetaceae bacterium]